MADELATRKSMAPSHLLVHEDEMLALTRAPVQSLAAEGDAQHGGADLDPAERLAQFPVRSGSSIAANDFVRL